MNHSNQIFHQAVVEAPRERVWRALTDASEFGQWFGVGLEGQFSVGEWTEGFITHPGYEHLKFRALVESIEEPSIFTYRWHPQAFDPELDVSDQPTTLVVFTLSDSDPGTEITVTETGFDAIPEQYREECFNRNNGGWAAQVLNIKRHAEI